MVSDLGDRGSARGLHTEAIKPLFGFNEVGAPSLNGGMGLRSLFSGPYLFFFLFRSSFTFFRPMCVRVCARARIDHERDFFGGGGVSFVAAPIH